MWRPGDDMGKRSWGEGGEEVRSRVHGSKAWTINWPVAPRGGARPHGSHSHPFLLHTVELWIISNFSTFQRLHSPTAQD